jgi:fibronectin type 3 domain-containing protein
MSQGPVVRPRLVFGRARSRGVVRFVASLLLIAAAGCGSAEKPPVEARGRALAGVSFVQMNYATPQTPVSTVTVPFTAAQSAGNLNVVVVGWNDTTAQVTSVTDSLANPYLRAVGPTAQSGALTQSIYYAKNIAAAGAGANSVKVTFTTGAQWPDIRVLEYSGIDQVNPVDVTSSATGNSATSSTPAVATTNASDLLFAANIVTSFTGAAGTGWTNRVITSPDGDIAEDRVVSATGSYNSTASLSAGLWVMQMVAFRGGGPDTQPPTPPSNLTATAVSTSQINLAWTASTDNVGVTSYFVESCAGAGCTNFAQIATTTSPSYSNTGLLASTTVSYRVRATDAAGNLSGYSNTASATTLAPDTQPPTPPSNLTATAVSTSQINLAWTASTDNVGVTGYLVESCAGAGCTTFSQIATTTATSYSNTGLAGSTTVSYRVRATDAAGNLSAYSNVASATTFTPDTLPPTSPTNLTATAASSAQINLGWTASTDNVGVTGYLVERCQGTGCATFAQIGSTANTAFANNGLSAAASYSYRVRATDAAGNLSGYSNVASATTPNAPFTPIFMQGNYATPQSAPSSVTVTYNTAQFAGDLNVVVVGWNDANARVNTISDVKRNTYAIAAGPTVVSGGLSQTVYYASNIASANAGENKVTVTFTAAAPFPDIRILEYRGLATTSPVDVAVSASGTSSSSNSGAAVTTNGTDLLFGANIVQALTTGPGAGYTTRMLTVPDGDIVEDRVVTAAGSYSAVAPLNSAGSWWIMQLVAFKASPVAPTPDTNPPLVTLTSPAAGATLSGVITVTVTASDAESGVEATQALVDGIPASFPDALGPYSLSVDTRKFANGPHSLGATAIDTARNVGFAAPITVTFSNATAGNPAATGLYSGTTPLPIVPVHQAQLASGKILMWDGQSLGDDGRVWDTMTNDVLAAPIPANEFCSAHEQMADGRIFVAGGHNGGAHLGLTVANAFDLGNQSWTVLPDMNFPRWYPTATLLPDGRLLVLSGESSCPGCFVQVPEIFSPATNTWAHLTDAPFSFPYYPHVYVLPDGRVLVPATAEAPIVSQIFDLNLHTWTAVGGPAVDGGSSAMYLPGKILKTGTSVDPDQASVPSVATAYVLDTTQPSPAWRPTAPMKFARTYHTLTMLPDGTVLATGGGPTTAPTDTAHATLPVELWSPSTETWTTLGSMSAPRLYHSSALLLPDARVVILGGGRFDDVTAPTDQFNAEFFAPPYLFKGPRPVITSAPATLPYGQAFSVQTPDAARIASVSLLRFGSVTHAINMAQRFLPLTFTAGSGSLSVDAPANANLATPGNYMLFLVDTSGVPSIAASVRL